MKIGSSVKMKTNRSNISLNTKISPFFFSSYSEKVSFRIFSRKNNLFREKSKNNIFHIRIETKNSEFPLLNTKPSSQSLEYASSSFLLLVSGMKVHSF